MSEPTSTPAPTTTTTTTTTSPPSTSASKSPPQKHILLIHGPNLNLLGYREPSIYGTTTLASLVSHLTSISQTHNIVLHHFQSNSEGALIDRIHRCLLDHVPSPPSKGGEEEEVSKPPPPPPPKIDAIIINPGAYTHTSVALRDALIGISTPFIEVHISNVHARESFRHHSYLSDKAVAVICGLGLFGYQAAIGYWAEKWKEETSPEEKV